MKFSYKIATIVWSVIIMVLSITPGNYIPPVKFDLIAPDTIAHVSFYLVLNVLALAWRNPKQNKAIDITIISIVGVLYGYLIEIIQGNFIPGRFMDYTDVISNSIGTISGIVGYFGLTLYQRKH